MRGHLQVCPWWIPSPIFSPAWDQGVLANVLLPDTPQVPWEKKYKFLGSLGRGGVDLIIFSITIYSYKKVQVKRTLHILYMSFVCHLRQLVRAAVTSRGVEVPGRGQGTRSQLPSWWRWDKGREGLNTELSPPTWRILTQASLQVDGK